MKGEIFISGDGGSYIKKQSILESAEHPITKKGVGPNASINILPSVQPWTPAEINNHYWLDGQDSRTLTFNNGVERWESKGSNRFASQRSRSRQPSLGTINGIQSPVFSNDYLNLSQGYSIYNKSIWFVCRFASGYGQAQALCTGTRREVDGTVLSGSSSINIPVDTDVILGYVSASSREWRMDGQKFNAGFSTYGISHLGFNPIGRRRGNFMRGPIGEFIFTNFVPDEATCEKIEGYLAWKWNLTGNLPTNHPYKTEAPKK